MLVSRVAVCPDVEDSSSLSDPEAESDSELSAGSVVESANNESDASKFKGKTEPRAKGLFVVEVHIASITSFTNGIVSKKVQKNR